MLYGESINPLYCDLKVYQDLFMFSFLLENYFKGAKILEIGGGDSRLLEYFKNECECWNLDKLEGLGNGPKELSEKKYRIVLDYIGNHNTELPENYFDFVFSISALEHVQLGDESIYENILSDINRILKKGGYSVHCMDHATDLHLEEIEIAWTNPLLQYFFEKEKMINNFIPLKVAEEDPELFVVPEEYYNNFWLPVTNVTYENFGKPFSYNFLWKKF